MAALFPQSLARLFRLLCLTSLTDFNLTLAKGTAVQQSKSLLIAPSSLSLSQMNVERRLFSFRFGDPRARMNWVHVDNLVLAHTLAAEALTLQRSCVTVSPDKHP